MSFYSLMNKYKVDSTDSEYTHVSMFPYGGCYKIPNENIEEFYNQYNLQIRAGGKYGILERPKDIGPMIVDIDIVKPSEKKQSLYTKERVMTYATAFQKYLASHTDIIDNTKLECYVLENVECILYTIDKENGLQRWDDFSKQSHKYDEDYLTKTWSRFKDYNYTLGSLIYLAREDDKKFSIKRTYTKRELLKMCRDKELKSFTSKSVSELCNLLCLPPQEGNMKKLLKKTVKLINVETDESQTFKSIYSAAKFVGRNPGSISSKKNTGKIIKSVFDNAKYTVEIKV